MRTFLSGPDTPWNKRLHRFPAVHFSWGDSSLVIIVLHYGSYKRQQLFDAARRSRACAYLADDDHGPLALQEILLAGCPVVGVHTGAPFVRDGITGAMVDRLPPGKKCVQNDADEMVLEAFMAGIRRTLELDRGSVRAVAAEEFATERIVDRVLAALESVRNPWV